jgi:hypothetical protein
MTPVRPAAAIAALLALASCTDAVGPLPRESAPQVLEFSIGGFGGTSSSWTMAGDTVVLTRRPWAWEAPPAAAEVTRVVPTAEEWRSFWAAAEGAGVRRWRGRYVEERIADGTGWGLAITAPGVRIEAEGSNAYPDRYGRSHSAEPTAEFQAFQAALEALVGSGG